MKNNQNITLQLIELLQYPFSSLRITSILTQHNGNPGLILNIIMNEIIGYVHVSSFYQTT